MTIEPLIDYEALTQDAMRSVVHTVLERTASTGLPGDHHFYISFDTQAEGVSISRRLKEKYPQEMTIVLQHRFWDLNVYDMHFEVKLTFDGIPERLVVPYTAIKVFFDPSVRYGLQFEDPDFKSENADHTLTSLEMADLIDPTQDDHDDHTRTSTHTLPTRSVPSVGRRSSTSTEAETAKPASKRSRGKSKPDEEHGGADASQRDATTEDDSTFEDDLHEAQANSGSAEIVSLDAFRKK